MLDNFRNFYGNPDKCSTTMYGRTHRHGKWPLSMTIFLLYVPPDHYLVRKELNHRRDWSASLKTKEGSLLTGTSFSIWHFLRRSAVLSLCCNLFFKLFICSSMINMFCSPSLRKEKIEWFYEITGTWTEIFAFFPLGFLTQLGKRFNVIRNFSCSRLLCPLVDVKFELNFSQLY